MSQFVDEAQLNVRGGDGGAGCVSFRREGPVAKGGPNGGDGGPGGDVWLVADHNVASLLAFRDHPHRRAGNGVHGKGKDMHGRSGEDEVVVVPEGTVVRDSVQRGRCSPSCGTTAIDGEPPPVDGAGGATLGSSPTSAAPRRSPSRANTARSGGCGSSCS